MGILQNGLKWMVYNEQSYWTWLFRGTIILGNLHVYIYTYIYICIYYLNVHVDLQSIHLSKSTEEQGSLLPDPGCRGWWGDVTNVGNQKWWIMDILIMINDIMMNNCGYMMDNG